MLRQEPTHFYKVLGRRAFMWAVGESIFSQAEEVCLYAFDNEFRDFVARQYAWTNKLSLFCSSTSELKEGLVVRADDVLLSRESISKALTEGSTELSVRCPVPFNYENKTIYEEILRTQLRRRKGKPDIIKWFVIDVDGVFTDGRASYTAEGEHTKTFNFRDGMVLYDLHENHGICPLVMTTENTGLVHKRMEKIRLKEVHTGIADKYTYLDNLLQQGNIPRHQVAYIGDDINDWGNIASLGWTFCPADAVQEIRSTADTILHAKGGNQAIREATDFLKRYNLRFNVE